MASTRCHFCRSSFGLSSFPCFFSTLSTVSHFYIWNFLIKIFKILNFVAILVWIIFVIITTTVIQLQQQAVLERFRAFSKRRKFSSFGLTNSSLNINSTENSLSSMSSWRRFLVLNGQIAAICKQITGLATFWKTFLTVIFAQYIVYQVYMAYIAFYSTSMTLYIRLFFFVTVLEINGLLFWLIANCASVLTANGRFEKANRNFAFSLFTSSITQKETSSFKVSGVRLVQLIKVCCGDICRKTINSVGTSHLGGNTAVPSIAERLQFRPLWQLPHSLAHLLPDHLIRERLLYEPL